MARKYIVTPTQTQYYETNYYMPFLNLVAGIIWSIPFIQKLLPQVEGLAALGIGVMFAFAYVVLSVVPVIAIVPCSGATVIYTAMLWGVADNICDAKTCFIVKVVSLLVVVFFEFCIFGNATLLWLQHKFPSRPTVRVVEE